MAASFQAIFNNGFMSIEATNYIDKPNCDKTSDTTSSENCNSAMLYNCHAKLLQANSGSSVESAGSCVSLPKSIIDESTIGNYKLVKTIGTGGFANVKLAKHLLTGEEVAIKIIDKSRLSRSQVNKLYKEARMMKMLNHPNIVKLYEVIDSEKTLYLVMQYVSGGDLFDYCMLRGTLTEQEARAIFRQVVSAVEYCHHMGVVHRDLKMENILLDNNMNIKITDFGLSNEYCHRDKLDSFCGTSQYIAPELFLEQNYGPQVDVWSLGVLLYILLTSYYPFGDSPLEQIKDNVIDCNYKIPSTVSRSCKSLLKNIFVLNPEKRATLKTIMKNKWVNQGYKKGELKPYIKEKQATTGTNEISTSWSSHVVRACRVLNYFCLSRRDIRKTLKS